MAKDDSAVIDLSHHNGSVDLIVARQNGVRAVIHKASQGTSLVDRNYETNRKKAAAAGLLWGAYHFGTAADVDAQVAHFLKSAGKPTPLLVLDFEANPNGKSMTLDQARAFVSAVHDKTGLWPGLYSGHDLKQQLGNLKDPVLQKCWLWVAQYGPRVQFPPNWQDWTLWQFTDGTVNRPLDMPAKGLCGTGPCDQNRFNGDQQALLAFWKANSGG